MRAIPLQESRQRFLRRARAEGIVFSRVVETYARLSPWYARPATMAPVAALIIGCRQPYDLRLPRNAGGKAVEAHRGTADR
jgi:hypothetical protein